MPQFKYTARKSDGKLIDGVLTCSDRAAAIFQVEQQGGVPIKIEAVAGGEASPATSPAASSSPRRSEPARDGGVAAKAAAPPSAPGAVTSLSHTHQHLFTEQLAHLLTAGMTLDEALGVLEKRLKHPKLHGLSHGLHRALVDGRSLSQALRDYPRIF